MKYITVLGISCFTLISTLGFASEPISPIEPATNLNAEKVAYGKLLFSDTRLSLDSTISCESCHNLKSGFGAEPLNVSTGINGQKGDRNSPTVFNSSLNFTQFWDGRAESLQHQALSPVTNPVEMGALNWDDAIDRIKKDTTYIEYAKSIYDESVNEQNVTDALAEFQSSLLTLNAPFDKYLKGDLYAISDEQKRGYKLFKAYGCVACHQGKNVGGNMFQKFGVLMDITLEPGTLSKDLGRYSVTGNDWDKRVFKVPSLRLVTKTAPYFHDGSVATLEEAVDIMIKFQLGREVPEADKIAIIAFLESLVGELPVGIN